MDSIQSPSKPAMTEPEPQTSIVTNTPREPEVPKKQKSLGKKVIISIVILLLLIVLATGGLFTWYKLQLKPVSGQEIATEFVIEPGTGAVTIADNLEAKGLVRSSPAFQFYLKQRGDANKLRAGTYLLSPSLSAHEVADVLVEGKVAQKLITIGPGLHLGKIKAKLIEQGFKEPDVDKALARKDLLPNLKPANASLEGYLFPESYSMPLDATANDVVEQAVQHFEKSIPNKLMAKIDESDLTFFEAVTLASIIQGETDSPIEQKKVATVFLNRLDIDMPLGADPTFRFAAFLEGVPESVSIDSPYNTRLHKGLPPGPISNFKITALEAVVNPDPHDYLYFVTGDDGKFHYSKTFEEHRKNTDKYCIELCKL